MYMEQEQKEFLIAAKYHTIVFFAAFAAFYILASIVSWEWSMKAWWWSVRLAVIACSFYMAYTYAPYFYKAKTIQEEENEEENYGTF